MGTSASRDSKLVVKQLIKNLAYYYAKGYTIENAAIKIDIDPQTALDLTTNKEWEAHLKNTHPEAFKAWKETKEDDSIAVHVRTQAKKDGPYFYNMMKEDLKDLPPKERIPLLRELLKLGNYFEKEESRETITLPPSQIMAIRTAKEEMDTDPDSINSPYDA